MLHLPSLDFFHAREIIEQSDIADFVEIHHATRFLEVGSRLGATCRYVAKRYGCSVVGIEPSSSFTAIAHFLRNNDGLSGNIEILNDAFSALETHSGGFDVILCNDLSLKFPNRDIAFDQLSRLLLPGGVLVFSDRFERTRSANECDQASGSGSSDTVSDEWGCVIDSIHKAGLVVSCLYDVSDRLSSRADRGTSTFNCRDSHSHSHRGRASRVMACSAVKSRSDQSG